MAECKQILIIAFRRNLYLEHYTHHEVSQACTSNIVFRWVGLCSEKKFITRWRWWCLNSRLRAGLTVVVTSSTDISLWIIAKATFYFIFKMTTDYGAEQSCWVGDIFSAIDKAFFVSFKNRPDWISSYRELLLRHSERWVWALPHTLSWSRPSCEENKQAGLH